MNYNNPFKMPGLPTEKKNSYHVKKSRPQSKTWSKKIEDDWEKLVKYDIKNFILVHKELSRDETYKGFVTRFPGYRKRFSETELKNFVYWEFDLKMKRLKTKKIYTL